MFTDIVGKTSFRESDAKETLNLLKKNRRIHKRLLKKFNGRLLKDMGSGILASFKANIDAVMCAVSIQKATEELKIPIKIGIHQGDVIFEKKDVLGDGVNITSRIQGLAERNDILISERVFHDLKNKEGLEIDSIGEKELKGVSKPLEIYRVTCRDENLLDYSIDTGELIRPLSFGRTTIVVGILVISLLTYALYYFLPKAEPTAEFKKSLLIMPFDNYISTDTLDYFVAGMHDQLIGKMGRIGALRVIPKTTSRVYKNADKSIPEIAEELGVNAIIETSVLCTGDSICLEVKLKSADEGKELWIKEFYEETSQILKLYNTITREISDEIDVKLRPQEEILLTEYRYVDPEALNAYLRGYNCWDYLHPDSTKKSIEYFQKAIDIDPDWADPYAGHAMALSTATVGSIVGGGWLPQANTLPRIYNNMNKALELDPNSASAHFTKAIKATWTEFDWEKAEGAFKRSLELNPSNARCRAYYSHLLAILRRSDESIHQAKLATELDPMNPLILSLCGVAVNYMDDYQTAITYFEKALDVNPNFGLAKFNLIEPYYSNGDYDKWFELWKSTQCWDDELWAILEKVFYEHGHIATIKELLRLHKEYENEDCWMHPSGYLKWYIKLQDNDKTAEFIELELDFIEELVANYNSGMAYLATNDFSKKFKDNPRYIALLKKMNLPLP
jgi:TolB-like protein